ncbi:MAG: hypothetical protein NTV54_17140 [Ignavibacteriales bacterium]|nr:hypothetical protein [Ignavibacteriales bacterium]
MNWKCIPSAIIQTAVPALILSFMIVGDVCGQSAPKVVLRENPAVPLHLYEPHPPMDTLSPLPPLTLRTITAEFPGVVYRLSESSAQLLPWKMQEKLDLAAPWKLQLAEENTYRTLRMVLGSIQVGGVAYLMYEHFKKK